MEPSCGGFGISGVLLDEKNEGYRLAKRLTNARQFPIKSGKLKPGTTYYYKVRSYKTVRGKRIYGDFSAVKSVRF